MRSQTVVGYFYLLPAHASPQHRQEKEDLQTPNEPDPSDSVDEIVRVILGKARARTLEACQRVSPCLVFDSTPGKGSIGREDAEKTRAESCVSSVIDIVGLRSDSRNWRKIFSVWATLPEIGV